MSAPAPFGHLLRGWRQRRRLSQLELALAAEVSTRHLSFLETGRSRPSRGLLLHLCELLELPLRERNRCLLTAGFAPEFAETPLQAEAMQPALDAVQRVLELHNPYPAVAVDRHWNLLLSNPAARILMSGVDPKLMQPAANVLRISLHPDGLAPAIINLAEWRHHLLARLRVQVDSSGDAVLAALLEELAAYPALPHESPAPAHESALPDVLMLFRLRSPLGELALFSTITVFGTPTDITLSELALEAFYPANAETAERLRILANT